LLQCIKPNQHNFFAKNGTLNLVWNRTNKSCAAVQAIEKAKNFGFDLHGASMASDAFFLSDCVE
jgi:phosphoribosylaminoimidazolecarboxamide formyltransferase/IMP cyclohydrolase